MVRVIEEVVLQHAEEAAFLVELRDHRARSPMAGLASLGQIDARLDAHAEALRVAGEVDWEIARPAWASRSPGECFAGLRLAFELRSWARVDELLDSIELGADEDPDEFEQLDACVMALAWLAPASALEVGRWWLTQTDPLRWSLGLACLLEHRVDPGEALMRGLVHPLAWTRVVAFRGAAWLGLPGVLGGFDDPCARVRLFARLAALRQQGRAPDDFEALVALAPHCPRDGDLACALGFAGLPPARVDAALQKILAADPSQHRLAVVGVVGVGDPLYLPWILGALGDPGHGLAATYALAALTGLDPDLAGLIGAPPIGDDDDDPPIDEPDIDCPWLDLDAAQRWWAEVAPQFPAGRRVMYGAALPDALRPTVLAGPQRLRALAAWLLALTRPGAVFAYDAPVTRQRRWLAQLGQAGGSP
jgi:uncharacterized protein (TIGR02270 family)